MRIPAWFNEFINNEFFHIRLDVARIKWEVRALGILVIAMLVKLFVG